jgi:hypothetical protein
MGGQMVTKDNSATTHVDFLTQKRTPKLGADLSLEDYLR